MAQGNNIVISENPRGRFTEGIINGALQPGICLSISAATEPVGGRFDWGPYSVAGVQNGSQRLIAVLLADSGQGKAATAAYVDNDRCFLYFPLPGDELNMLVGNQSGTADSFAIGDLLMIEDGTGELLATAGSPESEPFVVMATTAALTADALVHCMFTGY